MNLLISKIVSIILHRGYIKLHQLLHLQSPINRPYHQIIIPLHQLQQIQNQLAHQLQSNLNQLTQRKENRLYNNELMLIISERKKIKFCLCSSSHSNFFVTFSRFYLLRYLGWNRTSPNNHPITQKLAYMLIFKIGPLNPVHSWPRRVLFR